MPGPPVLIDYARKILNVILPNPLKNVLHVRSLTLLTAKFATIFSPKMKENLKIKIYIEWREGQGSF